MLAAILTLSVSQGVHAQVYYSTLVGTVRDMTGAVIANVEIEAIEVSTSVKTSGRTNENGDFRIENLRPGTYSVYATLPGFKKRVSTDILLVVKQTTRVDLSLEIGEVSEVVEVSGRAPLVQSETSEVGGLMGGQEIGALPILGRDFMKVALLFNGTITNQSSTNVFYGGGEAMINVNGGSGFANQFRVDGGLATNLLTGSPLEKVNIDSIQELKVETSNYSAEYGLNSGGVFSVATKYGTNSLHGTLFYYNRNEKFNAANFFAAGLPKAPVRYNQFGGVVGGPIIKDKLFFFGSYEGVRDQSPVTFRSQVPTLAERQGDFAFGTGVLNAPVFDPFNIDATTGLRVQFPNNRIPRDRWNAISQKYLALWPEPNTGGIPNFIYNGARKNNFDRYSVRFDYNINGNDTVFGRYGEQDNSVFTPGGIPSPGSFSEGDLQTGKTVIVSWTHLLSSSKFNDFRFSFAKGRLGRNQGGFSSDNQAADLGFLFASALTEATKGCPSVGFRPGFNTVAACSASLIQSQPTSTFSFNDDFSFVVGAHTLKAGVLYSHYRDNSVGGFAGGGGYTFTGNYTAQMNDTSGGTGQPFADFLLGYLGGISVGTGRTLSVRVNSWGGYLQDSWKVNNKLTLQLGLRYDVKLAPTDSLGTNGGSIMGLDKRNGQFLLYPKNSEAVLKRILPDGNLGLPYRFSDADGLYDSHWRDFGPRVGFAYRPFADSRTVIRGGFGIFYAAENLNQFSSAVRPWQGTAATPPRPTQFEPPPYRLGDNPGGGPKLTYQPGELFPITGFTDRNMWINGRSFQWNAMLQRGFSTNWSVEVGYIGNKFDHGQNAYLWNRTYMPGYTFHYNDGSSFTISDSTPLLERTKYPQLGSSFIGTTPGLAHGDYHAGQVSLIKQFSSGFEMRAGYTRSVSKGLEGQRIWNSSVIQDEWNQPDLTFYRKSDTPNALFATYVWQLPGFNRKGLVGGVLGGWQVAGILRLQSGQRVDIRELFPQWQGAAGVFVKPVMTCDPNDFPQRTLDQWFNTSCFQQPGPNQFGTDAATNSVRADGMENIDLSFSKFFNLPRENTRLQFRAELFNALNHAQFQDPGSLRGTATFGKVTGAYAPRIIQFALKLDF
ncbi:MAG: TonB-dependent receptor [Acidobacteriota bacterium]